MHEIKVILFDFGGVFTPSPFTAVEDLGRELGIDSATIAEIIFGPYHQDTDHPWHKLERGEISLDESRDAIKDYGKTFGHHVDLYELLAKMAAQPKGYIQQELVDFVSELRSTPLKTAIVTNNVKEFADSWRKLLPVAELFDAIIDSSVVGLRKPNPAIYQLALKEVGGFEPQNSLFIDDYVENVRAAQKLGIHGIIAQADPLETIANIKTFLAAHR